MLSIDRLIIPYDPIHPVRRRQASYGSESTYFLTISFQYDPPFLEEMVIVNLCSTNDKVLYGRISQNAYERTTRQTMIDAT